MKVLLLIGSINMEGQLSTKSAVLLEHAKYAKEHPQSQVLNNWPVEYNKDSEPEDKDLGFDFMKMS